MMFGWELKSIHRIVDSLPEHDLLIFTGPIDAYFAMKGLPKLEYRSVQGSVTLRGQLL